MKVKKKLRNIVLTGCLAAGISSPAHAFFNPFGMMGNMMGMFAQPVTDQMIGQMMSAMEGLMHSSKFRNDMANFILGTADEMMYELMISMQNQEPTFVGALAGDIMTGGAMPGSPEYNQAMQHWMTVFGPAMQARMELEEQQSSQQSAIEAEIQRREDLGVYVEHGDYNWDCHCYDPDYLAYRDNQGNVIAYTPQVALPGDPEG